MHKDGHIITRATEAIIPVYNEFGHLHSVIYESMEKHFITMTPKKLIEENCRFYFSTFEGRMEAARELLNITQMVPICISERTKIYLFPTCSPRNEECMWLNPVHIKGIYPLLADQSEVILTGGEKITIPMHKEPLQARIQKTGHLFYCIEQRVHSLEHPRIYTPMPL